MTYYDRDLAVVHHRGFGFHADACAPGIVALLEPVAARAGIVVEIGCGSGLLTRHLVDAGVRVVATDASQAMLDLAYRVVPDAEGFARIVLPDDPLPRADAIVGVGHALNYLPDLAAIDHALVAIAGSLQPNGVVAIDLCDRQYGDHRRDVLSDGRVGDDWAIITRYTRPSPDEYVRTMTTFVPSGPGVWRRSDEVHRNVFVDLEHACEVLAAHGVDAEARAAFGDEHMPVGVHAIVGRKRS